MSVPSAREQLNLSFLLSSFNWLIESFNALRDIYPELTFKAATKFYAVLDQVYVANSEHELCSYVKFIISEFFIKHLHYSKTFRLSKKVASF